MEFPAARGALSTGSSMFVRRLQPVKVFDKALLHRLETSLRGLKQL